MKRKIIIILALVLTIGAVICFVEFAVPQIYAVGIEKPIPANPNAPKMLITPMIYHKGALTPAQDAMLTEYSEINNKFLDSFIEENNDNDYHIDFELTVEKNKTTLKYFGTITDTETNETVDYEKTFVFDFCFAPNLIGETIK